MNLHDKDITRKAFAEGKEEAPKVENNFWGFFFLCIDVQLSEIEE